MKSITFELTTLQAPCVPGILKFRKSKKLLIISNPAFQKKHGSSLDVPLYVGHGLSRGRDNQQYLKFYMIKAVLSIYIVRPRVYGSSGHTTDSGTTGISCYLKA
jgi:hypothetical protein